MKTKLIHLALGVFIVTGMVACYPGGAEYIEELDLVLTNYDPDYNFSSVKTYYLADSIYHIVDSLDTPDRTYDSFIIAEMNKHLKGLGWTPFDTTLYPSEKPDVAIVTKVLTVTNVDIYYYPWYPYWGWGWYKNADYWGYPGYGWSYPWYGYGGTYVSTYTTGTVAFLMFDPDNVDEANERIGLSWVGVLNGVAGTTTTQTQSRISKAMDQAFIQSPYLKGN